MTNIDLTEVKIPADRIPVLLGKHGSTKRKIEKAGKIELEVDSDSGIVAIIQKSDPVSALAALNVVKAIGRGFNPEKAMILFNDEIQLVVVSLREYAKPGSHRISEIKGRLIGKNGKTRQIVEDLSGSYVSVYGDTVSIIADHISISYSLEAIQMLINGKRHRTVYSFLEKSFRDMKYKKLEESFGSGQ
ncbi:MAG: RNA-processing protein [Candidatus Thermoplasmatota archaeon]|jgi:ribosomal RNA assembly protein|nr:RNA-processing protein [Candidatus Thermoplasmatota archaeon]MCL5794147.1 RNA-processing protein [Candidatus Thermoplasmatota archaeon]